MCLLQSSSLLQLYTCASDSANHENTSRRHLVEWPSGRTAILLLFHLWTQNDFLEVVILASGIRRSHTVPNQANKALGR